MRGFILIHNFTTCQVWIYMRTLIMACLWLLFPDTMSIVISDKESTDQLREPHISCLAWKGNTSFQKVTFLLKQGIVKVTLNCFKWIPYGNWDEFQHLDHVNLRHLGEESWYQSNNFTNFYLINHWELLVIIIIVIKISCLISVHP